MSTDKELQELIKKIGYRGTSMEQHHYFLNVEHKDSDFFSFTDYFLDKPYTFKILLKH